MMQFYLWGDEELGFILGIKEEFHNLPINNIQQSYIERMKKTSLKKLRETALHLSMLTSFGIFCDCIAKQSSL